MICFFLYFLTKTSQAYGIPNIIEHEEGPSFVKGMDESTSDIYQFIEQATTIEDQEITSKGRTNTFYKCEITVKGRTKFLNNYAFGAGVTSGSGGAIFICESIFQAYSDSPDFHLLFESNQAALGGAICAKASAMLLYNSTFTTNMAYKHGGAIYFESTFKPTEMSYLSSQVTFIAGWLEFRQNVASEVGGAIAISYAIEVYIELSKFYGNKCSFTGGAISTANCDSLKLHKNWFAFNTVNASAPEYRLTTDTRSKLRGETISNDFANTIIPNHMYGRGGGAIYFFSDSRKGSLPKGPKTYGQRIIQTYHCCFYKDSSTLTGSSLGGGAGNEVLLDGYIEYVTYDDYIYGAVPEAERDEAISKVNRPLKGNCSVNYLQMRNSAREPSGICEVITTDIPGIPVEPPSTYNETNISYINATGPDNGTVSEIPPPTAFQYLATPITIFHTPVTEKQYSTAATKLGPSLKSGKVFPGSYSLPLLYSNFTITIPKPTPHETPVETPFSTPKYSPSPSDIIIVVTIGPTLPSVDPIRQDIDQPTKKSKLLGLIAGIIAAFLALVALTLFLIWYFKRNDESTEESALSLQEETVITAKDMGTTDVTITYTNPLWTTGIEQTDDPFQDDFQEQEKIENFFEQKDLR